MKEIVTVTLNPALDKSARIDNVVPDQKLRCGPPRFEPGGGGVNVARAIHRLGGSSRALYTVGGPFGEKFEDLLEEEGVNCCPFRIEGMTRESFVAFEESTGKQYRFSTPGPELSGSEWERCFNAIANLDPFPDYLVGSGSLAPGVPVDGYARMAHLTRERGGRFIIDTSGEMLREAADAGVYLLKPNMRELGHLAGRKIESEEHQEEVARNLVEEGKAEVVVVSLGAAGALLVTRDFDERIRAPTVKIESKIGAGDSMVAGIVLALARGESLRHAVRFGVAAGAAAVKTPGTELCRRDDTEALYEQMLEKQPVKG